MRKQVMAAAAAGLVLAGCGGDQAEVNAFAFNDISAGVTGLGNLTNRAVAAPDTAAINLPSGGTSRYEGYLLVAGDADADTALGTVRLYADFDVNSLEGSAGSFRNLFDQPVDGNLQIRFGNISSTGDAAGLALIDGNVELGGQLMSIDSLIFHAFNGSTGQFSLGAVEDTQATPTAGGVVIPVDIVWVAERQ